MNSEGLQIGSLFHRIKMHQRASTRRKQPSLHLSEANACQHLRGKLTALAAGMNRPVDIFALLQRTAPRHAVHVQVPETLEVTGAGERFLFLTDLEGAVQVITGPSVDYNFLSVSSLKNKSVRNLNPLGVRYPKFITFRNGAPEFTVMRKRGIRSYLRDAVAPYRVQRFIIPFDYCVQKTLLHWRLQKHSREFSVSSRIALRGAGKTHNNPTDPFTLSLDPAFIVSSTDPKLYDIATNAKISECHLQVVSVLRAVLEESMQQESGRMVEFLVHVMKSQDGVWYFLQLKGMKVEASEDYSGEKMNRTLGGEEAESALAQRLNRLSVPYQSAADSLSSSISIYNSAPLALTSEPSRDATSLYMSSLISEVSAQFDVLRVESRELKREFGVVQKVQFTNYPKDLLTNVIRRVYELIVKDPRLSRYYPDKSRIHSTLASSLRQLFLCGSSRFMKGKMRAVHAHLGISDFDFDLYLRYFADSLKSERVESDDIDRTLLFLEDFREFVVQP